MDRIDSFVLSRSRAWSDLESRGAEYRKAGGVPPERAVAFARAYRDAAADLSAARAMGCPAEVIRRLNAMVSLGHGVVYRRKAGVPGRRGGGTFRSIATGFPMAFFDHPRLAILSVALFLGPAALAFLYVAGEEARVYEVFPSLQGAIRPADGGAPRLNVVPASLSSYYIVNNTLVAMRMLARGMLLGFGTVYDLGLNGMLLGALAAHFANHGDLAGFWPQILPHGVTELLALVAAGQAGLLLARAIWLPGDYSRRDALGACGREVGLLALGTALLLLWSGVVESYVTRSTGDRAVLHLFAAAVAAAVACWFLLARRSVLREREAAEATAGARP